MKILQFLFVLLTIDCFAQKTAVVVNSPGSLAGEKVFAGADFGADLSSKLWTSDLVMAQPNLACSELTNGAEIAGKICVIDRGTCLFADKSLAAENAGAIGVIILNHNDQSNRGGPPFQMGGTGSVTIPVVMLGYTDGVLIKEAMASGTVNVTMGGFPKADHDLAISRSKCDGTHTQPNLVHPTYGSYLMSQLRGNSDFSFLPGGFVDNVGNLTESTANLDCEITYNNQSLYKQTVVIKDIASDSKAGSWFSSPFEDLSKGEGRYNLSYTTSTTNTEPYLTDNAYNTYFDFSNSIISKSRFSPENRAPVFSGAYYFGGGTGYREYMMPFRLPYGKDSKIDTIYGNITADVALAGAYLEGRIYRWDDLNSDNNINTEEMTLVALGSNQFDDSETSTSATMRIPLENLDGSEPIYTVPKDGDVYFASIQYPGGSHSVFFGYDHNHNQKIYVQAKDSAGTLDITDYPYLNSSTQAVTGGPDMDQAGLFYFDCDGSAANEDETVYSPIDIAVHIISGPVATKDLGNSEMNIELLSNPVSEILTAKVSLKNATRVNYQIVNSLGHIIYQETNNESAKTIRSFDLSSFASGNYILKVSTEKTQVSKKFVVVR